MGKNWNSRNNTYEILFFLSYGIYLLTTIINASFFASYINSKLKFIMLLCGIIIVFNEMLVKKIKLKELCFLFFCILLSCILLIHTNGVQMFPVFLFLYGARHIKFDKIAKFTLIESCLLLMFIILSSKLGLILNYVEITGERMREYLGFRYALFPQMLMFNITAISLYIYRKRKSNVRFLILLVVNYWMFRKTNSRLSFYLAIILILAMFMLVKFPNILKKRKIFCFCMSFSFIFCSIFSIFIISNYDSSNNIMYEVNNFFGQRLYLGKISLDKYNINLFGHDTEYVGNGLDIYGNKDNETYFYVDCLYLNILEKYGLIFTVLFMLMLTYVLYKSWKSEDYGALVILSMFALHGLIDDLEIYLYYNTFWFIISKYFIQKSQSIDTNLADIEIGRKFV